MSRRLLRVAGPIIGVGVLALALRALHEELRAYHYRDIARELGALCSIRLRFLPALTYQGAIPMVL